MRHPKLLWLLIQKFVFTLQTQVLNGHRAEDHLTVSSDSICSVKAVDMQTKKKKKKMEK